MIVDDADHAAPYGRCPACTRPLDRTRAKCCPDLFDVAQDRPGLARRDGRDTSKAAARAVKTGTARYRVLEALARADLGALTPTGLTDAELADRLKMNPSTERPRRVELMDDGLLVDSGDRRDGMAIWQISPLGRTVWATISGPS